MLLLESCDINNNCRILCLPENLEILYDTTIPDRIYKYQSVAYSLASVYELNKKVYYKCYSDSIRTDIVLKFYYVGNLFDKEELKRRLKNVCMHNTIIYWDKDNKFANMNGIDSGMHFIAYVTDIHNKILKMGNPTVMSFKEEELDRLK